MIQAPQLYVLHPHMAPSSPKTPHPVPQAYIQFPAQKMPAWRASGSWWHTAAASGHLEALGLCPKLCPCTKHLIRSISADPPTHQWFQASGWQMRSQRQTITT